MTGCVGAIGMRISGPATLMTNSNDLFTDSFSEPAVEYEILAPEFIGQSLCFHCVGIMDDASFEVVYIAEAVMQQVCACFFTTDATGAIHDDVRVFFIFQHLCSHG